MFDNSSKQIDCFFENLGPTGDGDNLYERHSFTASDGKNKVICDYAYTMNDLDIMYIIKDIIPEERRKKDSIDTIRKTDEKFLTFCLVCSKIIYV